MYSSRLRRAIVNEDRVVELDTDGRGCHGRSKFVDGWVLGVGWMLATARRAAGDNFQVKTGLERGVSVV
jgi:hypothetical protein